jgi:hypothetical protein
VHLLIAEVQLHKVNLKELSLSKLLEAKNIVNTESG